MNLLIPYVQLPHADPAFDEFTYGDVDQRARKMKSDLKKGDHVFFHTSQGGKKYITVYYIVDRVMDTADACRNKDILDKYQNPHLAEFRERKRAKNHLDDAILFGDPIASQILPRPGQNRKRGERFRIGVVRRPPRGVRKEDYAQLNYYDVWFPMLAPSQRLLSWIHANDKIVKKSKK